MRCQTDILGSITSSDRYFFLFSVACSLSCFAQIYYLLLQWLMMGAFKSLKKNNKLMFFKRKGINNNLKSNLVYVVTIAYNFNKTIIFIHLFVHLNRFTFYEINNKNNLYPKLKTYTWLIAEVSTFCFSFRKHIVSIWAPFYKITRKCQICCWRYNF